MTEPLADTAPGAAPDDGAPADERGSSDSSRLRAQVRQAEARADRAERALERMERSAKYTVGSLFVEAARSPRRLLLLPRDLWRVWRLRRRGRGSSAPMPGQRSRRDELLDVDAARLLLPRAAARPDTSFAVVGALSASTAAAWSPYVAVTAALPHEAAEVVLAMGADVVIIESAAALPGEDWAFLGDPAAADRQVAAQRLVDAARGQGIPVVLVRNTSPAHTAFLGALAARCDLVVDGPGSRRDNPWQPGIDPSAWANAAPGRDDHAVLVGPDPFSDARAPLSDRALADALARALRAAGIATVAPDPRLPVVAARRAVVSLAAFGIAAPLRVAEGTVGAPPSSVGILASGRRLVGGRDSDLDLLLARAPWAQVTVGDGVDMAAALASAQVALTDDERRTLLREIIVHASAPVGLQDLAQRLGLRARPISCWDVALVTSDPDIDDVLLQSWRPREVLVTSGIADRARDSLAEHGIAVVAADGARTRDELALAATARLLASQVDLSDRNALADLLAERVGGLPARPRHSDAALWSTT